LRYKRVDDKMDWTELAIVLSFLVVIAVIISAMISQSNSDKEYKADMKACDVKSTLCERNECRMSTLLQYGRTKITDVKFGTGCGC